MKIVSGLILVLLSANLAAQQKPLTFTPKLNTQSTLMLAFGGELAPGIALTQAPKNGKMEFSVTEIKGAVSIRSRKISRKQFEKYRAGFNGWLSDMASQSVPSYCERPIRVAVAEKEVILRSERFCEDFIPAKISRSMIALYRSALNSAK